MKTSFRIVAAIFALLLSATSSFAVIANVQHAISTDGVTGVIPSKSVSFGAAVTSGNAYVGTATYSQNSGADCFASLVDDKGNAPTVVAKLSDTAATQFVLLFHIENVTNGPTTVTISFTTTACGTGGGAAFVSLAIAEFSGVATTSAIDGSTSQVFAGSTTTNAVTSGNITTTANGDLIYSAFYDENVGGATFTAGTGFTALDINPSSGTFPFGHEWQVQSTAGSIAGTWTQSISGSTDVLVLALKAAGGGGGTPPNRQLRSMMGVGQ
jgi:hypothetical protein